MLSQYSFCVFRNCNAWKTMWLSWLSLHKAQMTRNLHVTYKIPYVYRFITKLCRQQAEFTWIYGNEDVRKNGWGEAQHTNYKRLTTWRRSTFQMTKLLLEQNLSKLRQDLLLKARLMCFLFKSVFFLFIWSNSPHWARASSFTRFLDHTQLRATDGRTPLDKYSARRKDLYLTTQHSQEANIHTPR